MHPTEVASLDHAMDILWLYQNISSEKDRENGRKFVTTRLKDLVNQ